MEAEKTSLKDRTLLEIVQARYDKADAHSVDIKSHNLFYIM